MGITTYAIQKLSRTQYWAECHSPSIWSERHYHESFQLLVLLLKAGYIEQHCNSTGFTPFYTFQLFKAIKQLRMVELLSISAVNISPWPHYDLSSHSNWAHSLEVYYAQTCFASISVSGRWQKYLLRCPIMAEASWGKEPPPNWDAESESTDQIDYPAHEAVATSDEGNFPDSGDSDSDSSSDSKSCSSLDDVGTLSRLHTRSILSIEDVPPGHQALEPKHVKECGKYGKSRKEHAMAKTPWQSWLFISIMK